MSEILLRVVDKVNDDPYLDCKLLKAGDLVTVQDDGWSWGVEELRNPDWRVVKMPAVPLAVAQSFLGPEFDTDPANPSRMLRRRAYHFNIYNPNIPAPFAAFIADATRAAPFFTTPMNITQLLAFKLEKAPLPDPHVMG